jgi:hypothetical protein
MSEELSAAKSKLTEMDNKVEDIELKGRRGLAELGDKVEIERLLGDMLNWVIEFNY